MLAELKALSNDEIHAWVHTAAVLDYVVEAPAEGKLASQQGPLQVNSLRVQNTFRNSRRKFVVRLELVSSWKLESNNEILSIVRQPKLSIQK